MKYLKFNCKNIRKDIDYINSKIVKNDLISPLIKAKNNEIFNHNMELNGSGSGLIFINNTIKSELQDIKNELNWYYSLVPYTTIPSKRMKKWNQNPGLSNSNYGFIVFSAQNGLQYSSVLKELVVNKNSRRAIINYAHPFIQYIGNYDFICTQYVAYYIRDDILNATVSMRSNDAINGLIYCDLYWQLHILQKLANDLNINVGKINWHSTNIHLHKQDVEKIKGI